jgi:hypothetical protein
MPGLPERRLIDQLNDSRGLPRLAAGPSQRGRDDAQVAAEVAAVHEQSKGG